MADSFAVGLVPTQLRLLQEDGFVILLEDGSDLLWASSESLVEAVGVATKQSPAVTTGTSVVLATGQATKQSVAASAGTSVVTAVSNATKQSTAAVAGTVVVQEPASEATKKSVGTVVGSSQAQAELEGFKIFEVHPTGTSVALAGMGALAEAAGTSVAVEPASQATKKAVGLVVGTSAVLSTSNATKASPGVAAGTVAALAVSQATKQSVGLVSASQTVAAVSGVTSANKQSVAAVSENLSVVLGIGLSKLSIHPKTVLNAVSDPSTVTLNDLPDPVPLTIV